MIFYVSWRSIVVHCWSHERPSIVEMACWQVDSHICVSSSVRGHSPNLHFDQRSSNRHPPPSPLTVD